MKRGLELGTKETLKERIVNSLKGFGRLRLEMSHTSIISYLALLLVLFVAFTIRVLPLRWEIPSGTVRLGEFDSYFYYSLSYQMVHNGLFSPYWPTHWINMQQNYPWGLDMSQSLPVMPFVGAVLYDIISFLGANVDLMTFCSILPPILGTLSVLVLYFIGKDMGGKTVGLLAALFLALDPSVINRSNLGWFETEPVGVLGLLAFTLFFLRAIDTTKPLQSSIKYSLAAGLAIAIFCGGWGAAYYLLGLVAIFAFVMILLRRNSHHLLLSYSLSFGLGFFLCINMPYLSLTYLLTVPVLAIAGVFALLCLTELWHTTMRARSKTVFAALVLVFLVGGFALLWLGGNLTGIAGKFWSTLNPFARGSSPILESVAEHQITAWGQIYTEFGISILFLLAGLYFTLRNPTNRNVFLVLFGLTSLYFASSMVRLLVILAPAFSLLAAIGILGILKPFYTLLREAPRIASKTRRGLARASKEYSGIAVFLVFLILVTNLAFSPQTSGVPRVYGEAYVPLTISAASLPIAPAEPVPEWINMLSWAQHNLNSTTVVCAWWDYGEWLSILGNVTTLADNTTVNTTQIENIGFSFMANETQSLKMLAQYDAKYILVFTTLAIGTSSSTSYYVASPAGYGDEGKWFWMARISGQAHDRFIGGGFIDANSAWTNEEPFGYADNTTGKWVWSDKGTNSTVYKLMSWAKQRWCDTSGAGYVVPDEPGVQPEYFKEAYFSGEDVSPTKYGGLIPLVALYEIDWQKYYNATSAAS
jgi:dolichyl-diphosphooligosaccharide--protein glycosyltransferase